MPSASRRSALLAIDFINPLLSTDGALGAAAVSAARATAKLIAQARRTRMPVIYANDHFGDWHSEFSRLLDACREGNGCGRQVLESVEPGTKDFAILKPRHSAFYGTPLEFLLEELRVGRLILTGLQTDICVMATAQDAYMRKFKLWVPRNCVASESKQRHSAAIELLRANFGADTHRSNISLR